MARSARHPCRQGRCSVLLASPGYCEQHKPKLNKEQAKNTDEEYKERNRFYQRKAWKTLRANHLMSEPLCRECRKRNRLIEATTVDHVVPITSGGMKLDDSNLQSLCSSCHNRKTLAEGMAGKKS